MNLRTCVACMAAVSAAVSAEASVSLVSQSRTVSATSFSGRNDDAAPDLGVWSGNASSVHRATGTSASAQQDSSLSPTLLVDSFIAAKDGQGPNGSSSESIFRATFSLDQAASFTLAGNWQMDWDGVSEPTAIVLLHRVGDSTPIFLSEAVLGATPLLSDMFSTGGVLAAGDYELIASITQVSLDPSTVQPQVSGTMHAELVLQVPAPGVSVVGGSAAVLAFFGRRRRTR